MSTALLKREVMKIMVTKLMQGQTEVADSYFLQSKLLLLFLLLLYPLLHCPSNGV